jgi:hypothetical protein
MGGATTGLSQMLPGERQCNGYRELEGPDYVATVPLENVKQQFYETVSRLFSFLLFFPSSNVNSLHIIVAYDSIFKHEVNFVH